MCTLETLCPLEPFLHRLWYHPIYLYLSFYPPKSLPISNVGSPFDSILHTKYLLQRLEDLIKKRWNLWTDDLDYLFVEHRNRGALCFHLASNLECFVVTSLRVSFALIVQQLGVSSNCLCPDMSWFMNSFLLSYFPLCLRGDQSKNTEQLIVVDAGP